MSENETAALRMWLGVHREHRRMLHTGTVVHADLEDSAYRLEGVVGVEGAEALFAFSCVEWPGTTSPGRVVFPGLRQDAEYRIAVTGEIGAGEIGAGEIGAGEIGAGLNAPEWMRHPVVVPGSVATSAGLEMPIMRPDRSVLLHFTAV